MGRYNRAKRMGDNRGPLKLDQQTDNSVRYHLIEHLKFFFKLNFMNLPTYEVIAYAENNIDLKQILAYRT